MIKRQCHIGYGTKIITGIQRQLFHKDNDLKILILWHKGNSFAGREEVAHLAPFVTFYNLDETKKN